MLVMISLVIILFSLLSMYMGIKHLLLLLLSFELMALGLFSFISLFMLGGDIYFTLVYIVMVACESVLGLSMLVSLGRLIGSDYLRSFNMF